MTCQDSFHEVAFNISFWTRNMSSARILFWRGVDISFGKECKIVKKIKAKPYKIIYENLYLEKNVLILKKYIILIYSTQFKLEINVIARYLCNIFVIIMYK